KSHRRPGRPGLAAAIRDLIQQMSQANFLWGAPRIHGELLKLALRSLAERTHFSLSNKPRPNFATLQHCSLSIKDVARILNPSRIKPIEIPTVFRQVDVSDVTERMGPESNPLAASCSVIYRQAGEKSPLSDEST